MERIATTTEFNGTKLLDGSFSAKQFQVGANANETIDVTVSGARTTQIGSIVNTSGTFSNATVVTGEAGTAETTADSYVGVNSSDISGSNVTINGKNIVSSSNFTGESARKETSDSAFAKAAAINASGAGVTAVANNRQVIDLGGTADALQVGATIDAGDSVDYQLSVNGETVYSTSFTSNGETRDAADIRDAINAESSKTGVTASLDGNNLVLENSSGGNIELEEAVTVNDSTNTTTEAMADTILGTTETGTVTAAYRGDITLQSNDTVNITAGANVIGFAGSQNVLTVDTTKSVSSIDISTVQGANDAILATDAALDSLNSARAQLGAIQSRFESTISNLASTSENLSAANSRILDADFAAETAKLAKSQVLQQAGISVLAQANARPQQVLSLLQ